MTDKSRSSATQDAPEAVGSYFTTGDACGPPKFTPRVIDWNRVYATTRFRSTPTSAGLLVRMLLVAPFWGYTASLALDSLTGPYRAFGYSYDGLIAGISCLWTGAVFSKSRVGRGR